MDWHYMKDGRQFGPVPETSIRAWLESGFLKGEDLVWRSGMPEWLPAGEVPELRLAVHPTGSTGQALPAFGATLPPPAGVREYAGFWLRAGAYFIDSILLSFVLLLAWAPKLLHGIDPATLPTDPSFLGVSFGISWAYYAILEASPWQATLGKRAFRLRVTDLNGRRISFVRATLRQLGKILSGLPFYLGYVITGFTPRRQALHDMIAGCLVVRS